MITFNALQLSMLGSCSSIGEERRAESFDSACTGFRVSFRRSHFFLPSHAGNCEHLERRSLAKELCRAQFSPSISIESAPVGS